MIDREKVFKGLECCSVQSVDRDCDVCPIGFGEGCALKLKRDALALLKAQEPRVMTLEEVADWHKKPESEREPIYVEYLPNSGLGISRWTIEYFGFNPNLYPNKNSGYYGKWLRCWTSRPTDEQREATPWEP